MRITCGFRSKTLVLCCNPFLWKGEKKISAMRGHFILLVLLQCLFTGPIVGSGELGEYLEGLVNNPLDSAQIATAERAYQGLVQSGFNAGQCDDWHHATATLLMAELRGLQTVYMGSVLLDLQTNAGLCPPPDNRWWHFILGSAHFVARNYEEAIATYAQIQKDANDANAFWLYAKAQNNLASSYNGLQLHEEAIQTFEALSATLIEADEALELDNQAVQDFHQMITINLGGLLVSVRDYQAAEAAFRNLDESKISAYWNQIIAMNRLLIFQETGLFEKADSLWVSTVRSIPHSAIQSLSFRSFLRQAILSDDAAAFKALSEFILDSQPELLLTPNFFFTPLVRASQNAEVFKVNWSLYKTWEAERMEYIQAFVQDQSENLTTRINELNTELSKREEKIEYWRQMLMYGVAGVILVLLVYLSVKRHQVRSSQRELESVLASRPVAEKKEKFELQLDDVRTLGDAITQGKRTADAMLILQKMSMWLLPAHQSEKLNLESLENYEALTASEKKILNELLSGFEAKEIARMMKVSPPYIYNSRSHIRRKLEIPKPMSIEDWVVANAEKIKIDEQ